MTQENIHQKFSHINRPSSDAWNRCDQKTRSPCDFTVLEFTDLTDKYHPRPVDPLARAFSDQNDNKTDPSRIQIGDNVIDLNEIKSEIAYLTNQDKELSMNSLVSLIRLYKI